VENRRSESRIAGAGVTIVPVSEPSLAQGGTVPLPAIGEKMVVSRIDAALFP